MLRRTTGCLVVFLCAVSAGAQQTIYWKKDHLYSGPGGREIALVTPAPSDQTLPATPSGLGVSEITATSIRLTWTGSTDSGGSGLAGYKIYRQRGGVSLPVGTVGPGVFAFTDQPLTPHTAYTFTVVAFDNDQNHSAPSGALSATTLYDDPTPPSAPANLTPSLAARNAVRLEWAASSDIGSSGVAGYRVYRAGSLVSGSNPVTGTTYQDTNLSYKTTYSYTVVAVDNNGNASPPSSAVSITTDWELIIHDTFNRADGTSLGGNWEWPYCSWRILANSAYTTWPNRLAHCHHSTQSDFRATIDLIANNGGMEWGISFWHGSPAYGGGADVPAYRVVVWGGYLILRYYPHAQLNGYPVYHLGGADGAGPGRLQVVANSATRNIKVYFDGVLKINYTDPNTSRPNSGWVGFTGLLPSYPYNTNIYVDNFILEK